MSKIYTKQVSSPRLDGGLPEGIDKLTYDMVKHNVERNTTDTTSAIVAFDKSTLYILEQSAWQPITMRVDLNLLKSSMVVAAGESFVSTCKESDPICADYWSSGYDYNGKKLDHPAGWYEPKSKAYRFSIASTGFLEFRVDAPQGKNKVIRYIRLSKAISDLLCNLIGKSEATVTNIPEIPVNTATETELAVIAKFA